MVLISTLTFSQDGDIVKFQGMVMELDVKQNFLVASEKRVVWNANTSIYNEKGSPISFDKLKVKAWVYVEGVGDKVTKRITASKIYLIPKYINAKEKSLYPFMQ